MAAPPPFIVHIVAKENVMANNIADAPPAPPTSGEGSTIGRLVALLTPVAAIAAGVVAKYALQWSGVRLDQTQIVTFMLAAATSVVTAAWKWLQGWQQHERLVAERRAEPRRLRSVPPLSG